MRPLMILKITTDIEIISAEIELTCRIQRNQKKTQRHPKRLLFLLSIWKEVLVVSLPSAAETKLNSASVTEEVPGAWLKSYLKSSSLHLLTFRSQTPLP